jgi:hypothetical protein
VPLRKRESRGGKSDNPISAMWSVARIHLRSEMTRELRKSRSSPHRNIVHGRKPLSPRVNALRSVARIPLRSLKRILDHSKVRFTANPKSPSGLKQLDLRPFRFTKNGSPKFFNVPPGNPGSDRFRNASPLTLDGYPTFPANFAQGQRSSP